MKYLGQLFIYAAIAGAMVSCAEQYNIQHLELNADAYRGHQVEVQGKVIDTKVDPQSNLEFFLLNDQSGDIWILTHRDVPLRGVYVKVEGVFKRSSDTPVGSQLGDNVIEEYARTQFEVEIGADGEEIYFLPLPY